jgi:WD40 repeat protein
VNAYSAGKGTKECVKLLDLGSGHEVWSSPHLDYTVGVACSPNGRYLAVGTWSGARIWDLTRPKEPREIELKGQRNALSFRPSFSPDSRYLAAASSNTIKLWDVESGELRATLRGHTNQVFWTTFLDGGSLLAAGSEDRTVRFWAVEDALPERDVLMAHPGGVGALVFTPDGQTLISGGSDGRIRTWESATGRPLGEIGTQDVTKPVESLAVSHDGRILADPRVGLWDLGRARLMHSESGNTEGAIPAFSPVEAILAMARGGDTRLLDAETWKPLLPPLGTSTFHGVAAMAFRPDGHVLATAGDDQKVTLWEVATGRQLPGNLLGHKGGIQSLAFSPEGRALASGSRDGTVIIWDVTDPAKPSLRHELNGNAGAVWAVAYSPDGTTVAAGNEDGTVKLWDPITGRDRCTLVGHTARVRTVAFCRGGSVLATGDAGGTIRLWRRLQ